MMRRCFAFPLGLLALISTSSPAWAIDPNCRVVEVRFTPQGFPARSGREALSPQISVWVEQPDGKHLADLYVTRSVGLLGLGNRPGAALLKGDFRWPYGRRPMTLPVWAYRRGKQYGYVVMGGTCSKDYPPLPVPNNSCHLDFNSAPSDDDTTVAYHGPVSSTEPYFCSPSGHRTSQAGGVDVVTCASPFYGSKGWYAPGLTSPYPPRADLMALGGNDHPDVARFAADNDVAAISGATPPTGKLIDPIRWYVPDSLPDGSYVLWVEVNIENDFNAFWTAGKAVPEPHSEWDRLGVDSFGQPSIVYKVPLLIDHGGRRISTVGDYNGYGDWRGQSGTINPPDSSISSSGGSGSDRLQLMSDDSGSWRVKAALGVCQAQSCALPASPTSLDLSETTDATLTVKFAIPDGPPAASYEIRYRMGSPITDADFVNASPAMPTNLGPPGTVVSTRITGLAPKSQYFVAVRPKNCCGQSGMLSTGSGQTSSATFTTLSGCFIATAAYGSELATEVDMLRRFRDQRLLKSPLGQVAVASYYALSPGLAVVLADSAPLRTWTRDLLNPLVRLAGAAMAANIP